MAIEKSTLSNRWFNGIPVLIPNIATNHLYHHVSYNNHSMIDYGVPSTTAIVCKCWYKGKYWADRYLILTGNHYEHLNSLDLIGCLEYFSKNIHLKARHSDDVVDYLNFKPDYP